MTTRTNVYIIRKEQDIILYLQDNIMAVHAYAISEYLQELLDTSLIKKVWIDFHNCHYIDSTTIGVFIHLRNLLRSHNEDFLLCNMTPEVKTIIRNMCLHNYFHIIENEDIKEVSYQFIKNIPIVKKENFSAEFILQAHDNIIKVIPEKEEEFAGLFNTLKKQIAQKKAQSNNC